MKIKNEIKFQEYKKLNTDSYSREVIRFAESWANLMEAYMEEGKELEDVADQACDLADTGGITGFMYGAAVQVLFDCWKHGERLRKWHNIKTQLNNEGEKANEKGGVLNPALVTIDN